MDNPLIISASDTGISLAETIAQAMETKAETPQKLADKLRQAFKYNRPIIAVGAAGIIIRILAPLLSDKRVEPPVLCVAINSGDVVCLLGGHHGGNRMAQEIASILQSRAIITTANSELGEALENPPWGWRSFGDVKTLLKKASMGESLSLYDPYGLNFLPDSCVSEVQFMGEADIIISDELIESGLESGQMVFRPAILSLGIGCERFISEDVVISGVVDFLARHGVSSDSLACIGSIDIKSDEPSLHGLSSEFGVGLRFFSAETLDGYDSRLASPSSVVYAEVGCRGVAESASLASFGGIADLVVVKEKFAGFTCALSRCRVGVGGVLPSLEGIAIGSLDIVGIGPGSFSYRSEGVVSAIMGADVVIGYSLYLDLCSDLVVGKECLSYGLGEESERCLRALELASEGRKVALVCSGDAGIYALAGVVYDILEKSDSRIFNSVEVVCHPGISAFQLLSSRVGAIFGDDFSLISLSDLWVSESVIKRRIRAVSWGDFCVAFYNPQSRTRRSLLPFALEQLRRCRSVDTPVVVGRNLGRAGESVEIYRLGDFDCESVDMLSLVMVGNSFSRVFSACGKERVYTPRIDSSGRGGDE